MSTSTSTTPPHPVAPRYRPFLPRPRPRPLRRYEPHDPALIFRRPERERASSSPYRSQEREGQMKYQEKTHLEPPGRKADGKKTTRFWSKTTPLWEKLKAKFGMAGTGTGGSGSGSGRGSGSGSRQVRGGGKSGRDGKTQRKVRTW